MVIAAITEASLRGQIEATNELIGANTKMLEIMQRQLASGYANRSDVEQRKKRRLRKRGRRCRRSAKPWQYSVIFWPRWPESIRATDLARFKALPDLHLPNDLPVSLPSQLIEQRPDIRAAEEQLHAASAQIGVATASLLPAFTISANAGYMNTVMAGTLAPQNLFWQLAGNATQTVFDGGALLHQLQEVH